jgi:hypothetical protein
MPAEARRSQHPLSAEANDRLCGYLQPARHFPRRQKLVILWRSCSPSGEPCVGGIWQGNGAARQGLMDHGAADETRDQFHAGSRLVVHHLLRVRRVVRCLRRRDTYGRIVVSSAANAGAE